MYFLVLLRRAGVPSPDIVSFYCTCIRSILEYCAPVFHHALPTYLSNDLEKVQKRALKFISPNLNYAESLSHHGLESLSTRRHNLCMKLYNSMLDLKDQRFSSLLPKQHNSHYNLRRTRKYDLLRFRTERFKNTFIPAMCKFFN